MTRDQVSFRLAVYLRQLATELVCNPIRNAMQTTSTARGTISKTQELYAVKVAAGRSPVQSPKK